jgi:hypothetical protein
MNDSAPFSSQCPKCGMERVQPGYSREELLQLLDAGAEIKAYCSNCDKEWAVSIEERADVSRNLTRKQNLGR